MNNYKVYVHISPSGKRYIGLTRQQVEKRWKNGNGYNKNYHFASAIKKYGWDNFQHIIIKENLSLKDAVNLEKNLIKQYKSDNSLYGYNLKNNGSIGLNTSFHHSKETKKKLSVFNDLSGKHFNMLTVIKPHHKNKKGEWYYECICDCGNTKIIRGSHIKSGNIKSCGCLNKKGNKTHGVWSKNERIYKIWYDMNYRCNCSKKDGYKYYGGRGICVCNEWKNPINFMNWALNNGYSDDLTIDRINVNGNYEPSNCRWITKEEQMINKRNNHYITYNDETKCLSEWIKMLNTNATKFYYWKNKGFSDEQVIRRILNESNN